MQLSKKYFITFPYLIHSFFEFALNDKSYSTMSCHLIIRELNAQFAQHFTQLRMDGL